MGLAGNPRMSEEMAVQRATLISKHLGVPIHLKFIVISRFSELS